LFFEHTLKFYYFAESFANNKKLCLKLCFIFIVILNL